MKLEELKDIFNDNITEFENISCELINNKNDQLDKFKSLKSFTGQISFDKLKNEFQIISNDDIYIRFKVLNEKLTKDLEKNINNKMYNLAVLKLNTIMSNSQDYDVYLNTYFFNLKNNTLLELEYLNIKNQNQNQNQDQDQEDYINDFIIYTKNKGTENNIIKKYYFLYTILYKSSKSKFVLLGKDNKKIVLNLKTKLNNYKQAEEYYIEQDGDNDNNKEIKINKNNIYIGSFNYNPNPNNNNKNNNIDVIAIKNILNSENNNYLKVWGEYISREGDALLEHAKKISVIHSTNITFSHKDSMYVVHTDPEKKEKLNNLRIGDNLLVISSGKDIPYIKETDMNWEQYQESKSKSKSKSKNKNKNKNKNENENENENENKNKNKNKNKTNYTIEKIENTTIYIKTNNDTLKIMDSNNDYETNKKKFILDIKGSESQIKRREDAKDIIQNRLNPMNNLYNLLEGEIDIKSNEEQPVSMSNLILTPYVKEKIFNSNEPTATQQDAIKIAINTPDIAVIQGPPGTGKTTVITAILEALNENYDKTEKISGNILVTSFQHDAVENIIQKLQINALPTIKFGKRSNDDNDFNMDNFVKKWGEELIEGVKSKNINIKSIEEIHKLKEIINTYINNPTLENENKFLYYSKNLMSQVSSNQELLNFIDYTIQYNIDQNDNITSQNILKEVLNIRITKEGFQDDGAINAFKLYYTLRNNVFKNIKNKKNILNILYSAYKYQNVKVIPDDDTHFKEILKKLEQIRTYLLEKLKPKPLYMPPQINKDILNIYKMMEKELKLLEKEPKDLILYEYIESLENNVNLINSALSEYTTVFASTIQQTLSIDICKIKIPKNNSKSESRINDYKIPEYDTVIIDEAARANPGDLMIALMQAKNKIILVGDHRQLPHMYEENILDEIVSDNLDKKSITQSLFERLIQIVKDLEKKDYNKRFITLDTQYRMPKMLGNFISNNFYEKYGEYFNSPIEDEDFKQYLNLVPSCANWINVPSYENIDTLEKKENGSYKRKEEVDVIIEKIEKLIQTEIGKNLTYGIISFYKAQVTEIKKRLPNELKNKVRVGSVDAFQGLEFDVIFLSTVRTSKSLEIYYNKKEQIEADDKIEESNKKELLSNLKQSYAKKTFGFLLMENRLCVAMSRQKKILIIVGNLELFKSEFSQKFVPAMYNFYKLCEETGGIIN